MCPPGTRTVAWGTPGAGAPANPVKRCDASRLAEQFPARWSGKGLPFDRAASRLAFPQCPARRSSKLGEVCGRIGTALDVSAPVVDVRCARRRGHVEVAQHDRELRKIRASCLKILLPVF